MLPQTRFRAAFTLLELLVVIAIIGLLTVLLMSVMKSAESKAEIAKAKAELTQVKSAIDDYKTTLGFFPPDNPVNPAINPLYFELCGTTNDGNTYVTLDKSGQISAAEASLDFNRQGFSNTGTKAHSTDEHGAPMSFLNQLRPAQVGQFDPTKPLIKILVCSVGWPAGMNPPPIANTTLNPWCYVSSHPTNNAGSYDLWVDLALGGKTRRVNNWGHQP